jgi:hypothetical protein
VSFRLNLAPTATAVWLGLVLHLPVVFTASVVATAMVVGYVTSDIARTFTRRETAV